MFISFIVSIRSSLLHLRFSVAFIAAIVHRNHFFGFYRQNESSESKGQTSNCCKRVPEAVKLAFVMKEKSPSFPRDVALRTFGELLIVFSTKVNLLYLFYSTMGRCFLLHLIKQNCLLNAFSKNSYLDLLISLPVLPF